jgi:hypothetical protein
MGRVVQIAAKTRLTCHRHGEHLLATITSCL